MNARNWECAVLPLWGNKFRVNVWTAENGIPDSYFVAADERGTILKSEPPIQTRYRSGTRKGFVRA